MFKTINSFLKMISKASKTEISFKKNYRHVHKGDNTPSYLLIAHDLQSPHTQVFEVAVYYLAVIASLKKNYKDEIVNILNDALKANKNRPERTAYIENMLKDKKLI